MVTSERSDAHSGSVVVEAGGRLMPPVRVGIIGWGRVGRLRAQLVHDHPALQLTAAYDPDPAAVPDGAVRAASRDEVLANCDAVFVCTSNDATADAVVAALEAGRHVFCEKPPGRSLAEVRRMRDAAARAPDLRVKFGFNHRYHEGILDALALVQGGRFGRIMWLRGVYGKAGGPGFEKAWRNRRESAGGGILLDQGIHMVDLFRLFGGDFDEVKSFVGTSFWPIEVEDNAFAIMRNRHNQVAMLHSSSTHWKHQFLLEIFLSEGYLAVSGILSGSASYGRETLITARRQVDSSDGTLGRPREEMTYYDDDLSWQKEVADFVDCIQQERPVTVGTLDDAYKSMELVFRIYDADPSWSAHRATLEGGRL
ncbi:MAG: Gfo/Idh/MocA family protein [Vicinamibacterales bacterium]